MSIPLGKILGETDEEYHATPAVSKSKLDDFLYLPAYYYGRHVAKTIPREESEAFDIGKGVHAYTLEGAEAYACRFVTLPEDAPNRPTKKQINAKKPSEETKQAIAWWSDFNEMNAGRTLLSATDDAVVRGCSAAVLANPTARALLAGTQSEVSWRVQAGPMTLQCRTDAFGYASAELVAHMAAQGVAMQEGEPYAADIKTTPTLSLADLRAWTRKFVAFGYHRQGPFYQSVMKDVLGVYPERFFFIVVAKEAPHPCAVMLPDDEANEIGWNEVAKGLEDLRKCYATDKWPGLPDGVHRLSLPGWYAKDEAEVA